MSSTIPVFDDRTPALAELAELSPVESEELRTTLLRGALRCGDWARFCAGDADLFDQVYGVQAEVCDLHQELCDTAIAATRTALRS
jgi:hypothetical protein